MVEELFRLTQLETGLLSQDAHPDMSATYPKFTELYRYQVPVDKKLIFRPGHTFSLYAKYLNENPDDCGYYAGASYEHTLQHDIGGLTAQALHSTPVNGHYHFVGYRYKFKSYYITLVGANLDDDDDDELWDYYNGSSWADLPGLTDNTVGFSSGAGAVEVSWTLPGNWAPFNLAGPNMYYIRRIVAGYSSGSATYSAVKVHNSQAVDNRDMFKIEVRDQNELVRKPLIQDSQYRQLTEFTDRDTVKRLDIAEAVVAEPGMWVVISTKAISPVDVSECYFEITCDRERLAII